MKYPSVDLAYAAGRAGGTMTGVLSAANEKAVELFIDEKYDSFFSECYHPFLLSCFLDKALHSGCHCSDFVDVTMFRVSVLLIAAS